MDCLHDSEVAQEGHESVVDLFLRQTHFHAAVYHDKIEAAGEGHRSIVRIQPVRIRWRVVVRC